MGAVFTVPLARGTVNDLPGVKIALVPRAGVSLDGLRRSGHVYVDRSAIGATILVGSERDGLPDEVVAQADHVAHIPIATESLNAAMAATIALYELSRRMAPE
jgi:TrmH family RNA methyltransferase